MKPMVDKMFGVPIEFRQNSAEIAEAVGYWRFAKIIIGQKWLTLDHRTQLAVLAHEARHVKARHREQRALLCALMIVPSLVLLPWTILATLAATFGLYVIVEKICQWHELDADRFAARHGFGVELLQFIYRVGPPMRLPTFYPDFETRCNELAKAIQEKRDAVAAKTTV